jgi:hypothetical protein
VSFLALLKRYSKPNEASPRVCIHISSQLYYQRGNKVSEMKRIVWVTDGSKESEEALNYATFLAQKFDSKIIGVHVAVLVLKP